jgi:hypothetical protein
MKTLRWWTLLREAEDIRKSMGRQQQSARRLGRPMEWSLPRSFRGRCRSLLPQAFAYGIVLALGSLSADELPLYRDPIRSIAERTEDLLARMTLAEKIGQLTQGVVRPGGSEMTASIEAIRSGRVGSYILGLGLDDPTARNKLQEVAIKESRLGIPLIFGFDTIHGLRTVFPIPLAVSCAWDPGLFQELEGIAARESRAAGIDWVFGPLCDLARDPRWGRVAETFGEDPYLASLYAAAGVRGLQGEDPSQPDRVASCLKHFIDTARLSAAVTIITPKSPSWRCEIFSCQPSTPEFVPAPPR